MVSICDQTGPMMFIVGKKLTFPFKWLSTDIESASGSGPRAARVMTIVRVAQSQAGFQHHALQIRVARSQAGDL